jgi:ParB/RepB/Spo0J family partition protein
MTTAKDNFLANMRAMDQAETVAEADIVKDEYTVQMIPVGCIQANSRQVRYGSGLDSQAIQELADSIRQQGMLEPLRVEVIASQRYAVLCGHRRLAAAKILNLDKVPCIVDARELTDEQRLEIILVENLQRSSLSSFELAQGYASLLALGLKQVDIASKVGKTKSHVSKAVGFISRLSSEEISGLTKLEQSGKVIEFVRLELGSDISDPLLRHRALFEDMPLGELRKIKKLQGAPLKAPVASGHTYTSAYNKDGISIAIKVSKQQFDRQKVTAIVEQLVLELFQEHTANRGEI